MNTVTGHAHDALDDVETGFSGGEENDDVAVARVAIGDDGEPFGFWGENFAVNKNVVADEKRVLHRAGRDFKGLDNKSDDEKAGDQDNGEGGEELDRGLL